MQRYDVSSNAWMTVASIPSARSHAGAVRSATGHELLLVGGQDSLVDEEDWTKTVMSTLVYCPRADRWVTADRGASLHAPQWPFLFRGSSTTTEERPPAKKVGRQKRTKSGDSSSASGGHTTHHPD